MFKHIYIYLNIYYKSYVILTNKLKKDLKITVFIN